MRMMNEFEAQVLSDLSVLKTKMTGLMGAWLNWSGEWRGTSRTGSAPKDSLPLSAYCSL
jgi:hypothetical protein